LLATINAGELLTTPVGQYLATLRHRFPPEVIVDMLCLTRLHVELAIQAKGVLMAREAGFELAPNPAAARDLREIRVLQESIGKTGMRALRPFLPMKRDRWQLQMLETLAPQALSAS
jgi:hypothetical protein